MYKAPVKLATTLLLFAVASYSMASNARSAIAEASASGQYLCLIFYETHDATLFRMSSSIATYKKTTKKKISVYKANLSDTANQAIAAKYGIKVGDLPLLLVVAPNGAVTGGYPKTVTSVQLEQCMSVSDLTLETLNLLQEQKVTLVAFQNKTTGFNAESWQGVNDFATDPQFEQYVGAVKADPAAEGSQEFLKQCGLSKAMTVATVVVLLPPGSIGKIFTGKTSKADILKSLQTCTPGSGCCGH